MDRILRNLDPGDFIRNHWQKAPCLIRNTFVDLQSPVSPEELAGLACEEQVHSRLIQEKGADTPWQLRYGPFEESDFTTLPAYHYSLLVSECEKWIPEIAELQELFRFIPHWRHDDVMISYAPQGASVGAHVDEYDVFLIQLEGRRRWQYSDKRLADPELVPDLDLAILQSFTPDHDEVLEPGDMLYLPPGVPHHGIAVDNCMTCSIGFRAPTAIETLESFAQEIDSRNSGIHRYSDSELEIDRHPGEITITEINRFRQMVTELIEKPDDIWIDAVAKLLTDTVVVSDSASVDSANNVNELMARVWVPDTESRFLYHRDGSKIRFYANSQLTILQDTTDAVELVQHLCDGCQIDSRVVKNCEKQVELVALLISLVNNGVLVPLNQ
jgi:50S ribosomal protein L16 3-hydroxylase